MIARTTNRDPERATLAEPGARTADDAVFVTGSTMRHVVVMSTTGAAGLLAIFFVDFANLFYISLLGQQALAAAVGYASTLLFFTISFGIGLTIAATAITARAIGEGDLAAARKNATASLVYAVATTALIAAALYPFSGRSSRSSARKAPPTRSRCGSCASRCRRRRCSAPACALPACSGRAATPDARCM